MPRHLLIAVIGLPLLCGCRAMQSEMQRSSIHAAAPTAIVQGEELCLATRLEQSNADTKSFDLQGTIRVVSPTGTFPPGIELTHFSLKPARSGYYVMNFTRRGSAWELIGVHGTDPKFTGYSLNQRNELGIEFIWRNRGRGLGKKPEHFAAYDVSVTITDAVGNRHTLSNLSVPTK